MSETKRSALRALLAASKATVHQIKPSVTWNECFSLDTSSLSDKVHLLWTLVAELDVGRCKTIGAHQLGNLLESLAPLKHRALLDNIGQHFIQRLLSYGLSADYLNATSVLSQPLICWFASHGCSGTCRKLLAAKVNADLRELNFEAGNPTALLLASRGGFPDCVEVLIEGGADPHLTDDFGITAIHEAAGSSCSDDNTQAAVLSILLQHPSAHGILHIADASGQSPVTHAASRGFTACTKLLLDAFKPALRKQMASKALVSAAEAGSTEAVEALISAGATSMPSPDSLSALEGAAEEGHIGCVALMLRSEPKKIDLSNALLAAAQNGHEHILHLLIEAGANVNQPVGPSCTTSLMAAAGGGHLSCTQQLLDCHADAAYNVPDGTTALMAAASGGHTQCVAALVQADAPVDHINCNGMSAIMLAAAAGHVTVVQCLIKHKAALERLSFQELMQLQDSSPLLAAAAGGQAGAAEALLAGGALVDACDAAGATALMVAAAQGHIGCIRVLHSHQASLDLLDHQGDTALDRAAKGQQQKTVTALLMSGAKVTCSRSAAEILQTLSSSGSSQWDVIQMLQTVPQLMALLTTGDFIAFPTWSQGSRLHEALQVTACGLLGSVIMGLMSFQFLDSASKEQACAMISAMECLASLINHQPCSKQASRSNLHDFRELFQKILPLLHGLCDLATSRLEALHNEVEASHQSKAQSRSSSSSSSPQPADSQHPPTTDRQHSAQQSASEPSSVNLDSLSMLLSTIQAAAHVTQPAGAHDPTVQKVQELMTKISRKHAALFNEAVDLACRADAKQACVIWSWTMEVEGLLHGGNWQGLLQGALQALRADRHMAMWVPRQDMLEDMCHGFVGGTGFASDISAGLEIQFIHEGGVGSGVRRDWLNSMMTSMLDPQTGLFESCDGGHTWQPCPLAHMQEQHLIYFEMLGRAMGLALLHGEVLPGAHFTPNFLKGLLGQPGHLDDLRGNPPVKKFLEQLQAGQFRPEDLCLTFSCGNGLGPEVDLVPQGSQIEVTHANWREYYKHMLAFKLQKSIDPEVAAVRKGLKHIVDDRTMQLLHRYATPEVMDQLLAGQDCISVQDWRAHTLYKDCSAAEEEVRWFWDLVGSYSEQQLQGLLAFVTCSPAAPAGGFARLAGFNGGRHLFELCLLRDQNDNRLPRAATCFNTLYLPRYTSKAVMRQRLEQACSAELVFDEGVIHELPPASSAFATSPMSSASSDSIWQEADQQL